MRRIRGRGSDRLGSAAVAHRAETGGSRYVKPLRATRSEFSRRKSQAEQYMAEMGGGIDPRPRPADDPPASRRDEAIRRASDRRGSRGNARRVADAAHRPATRLPAPRARGRGRRSEAPVTCRRRGASERESAAGGSETRTAPYYLGSRADSVAKDHDVGNADIAPSVAARL